MPDNSEPEKRLSNAYATSFPKTDVRYWRSRVYRPVSVRAGKKVQGEHYAVQLQLAGKRMRLGLFTANAEEAAQKARRMYVDLVGTGWGAFLAKYRPAPEEPASNAG